MDQAFKILDYDQNGTIDYNDIFEFIKDCVKSQTKNKILDGAGKKLNVKNQVKDVIGTEVYNRYAPLIDVSIDFIYSEFFKSKCLKKFKCCC